MLSEVASEDANASHGLIAKKCPRCDAEFFGKTKHKQYCEVCRAERRLETYRAAAHVQRRKQGIQLTTGAESTCEMCSVTYTKTGSRQRYCETCKPIAALSLARSISYAKGEASGRKRVGRVEQCAHCEEAFIVTVKGRASYCDSCKALSNAGKLPHLVEAKRAYASERRKIPKHAINDLMRGGILKSITDKGGRSWQSLVDYTLEHLVTHLERQFEPGMTWDNRGLNGWHIDHRLPLSSFSFSSADDPEFQAAWALTNLQPMWGDENIRKKDHILYLI